MNKKYIFLSVVILGAALLFTGCGRADARSLSDFGGVSSWTFDDVDFSEEICLGAGDGLTGGDETEPVSANNAGVSNKLRGWGIKRNGYGKPPDADPGAPELLEKYNGFYIGPQGEKKVYLTFDEGYENGYTPKILDVLRDNNVKAAFFITGPYLNEHQDLVRRMVEEGHIVGNHTVHHPSLPSLPDSRIEEEVLGLDRVFKEKFNKNMKYLRPPKGEYSERTLAITNKLGYRNVFWSFAYDDWYRDKIRGPRYAYDIVMNNLHDGAVLLLHAVSKDNADALDSIIKGIKERGYEIGTLDEIP